MDLYIHVVALMRTALPFAKPEPVDHFWRVPLLNHYCGAVIL